MQTNITSTTIAATVVPNEYPYSRVETPSEHNMAVVSSVLMFLYIPLAVAAHAALHLERTNRKNWFSCPRRRLMPSRNRPGDVFFPIFQCVVVVPIAQATCIWRAHQTRITQESTLITWIVVLVLGCICACISFLWSERESYFAHTSTVIMLVPALTFLFEGAMRSDASGDMATACILIVSCAVQMIYPPRMLKDVQRFDEMRLYGEDSDVVAAAHRPTSPATRYPVAQTSNTHSPMFSIVDETEEDYLEYLGSGGINISDQDSGTRRSHPTTFTAYPVSTGRRVKQAMRRARDKTKEAWQKRARQVKLKQTDDNVRSYIGNLSMMTREEVKKSKRKSLNNPDDIKIERNYDAEKKYNNLSSVSALTPTNVLSEPSQQSVANVTQHDEFQIISDTTTDDDEEVVRVQPTSPPTLPPTRSTKNMSTGLYQPIPPLRARNARPPPPPPPQRLQFSSRLPPPLVVPQRSPLAANTVAASGGYESDKNK